MGNLSDSLQIKGFYRTQGTTTAFRKITIGSTRIRTILGLTEEEIEKEAGNQNAGQILGSHEKEVRAEPYQHFRKTFRRYRRFRGVSEEDESPARLRNHMQGR
jgi:hypothetical protein